MQRRVFLFMNKTLNIFIIILFPMIGNLSFHLDHVGIIGSLEYGKTICNSFKNGYKIMGTKLKIIMLKHSVRK